METQGITLADLIGTWRLSKRIVEAGGTARFEGSAEITPRAGGALYLEEGVLHLPHGPSVSATRTYLWHAREGGIDVRFEDGRPFYTFQPGQTRTVRHDCAPDLYDGTFDWSEWPAWDLTWRVTGPRKAYHAHGSYRRPAGA